MKHIKSRKLFEEVNRYGVWYHGSSVPITKFEYQEKVDKYRYDQNGPGFYLTNNIDDAYKYGKYIHEITFKRKPVQPYKNIRNLGKNIGTRVFLENLIKMNPNYEHILTNWDENPKKALNFAANSLIENNENCVELLLSLWYDFFYYEPKLFIKIMVEQVGFDGFERKQNETDKHFILWNSDIINIKIV